MNKSKVITLGAVMAVAFLFVGTAQAKTLSVGSSGSLVSNLQSWLIEGGYTIPLLENGGADFGYFGSQTQDAVKMYQEEKGLSQTGSIDSNVFSRSETVGSVSSPDIMAPYFSFGGIRMWNYTTQTQPVTVTGYGSTTCSILSPAATSSLVHASANFIRLATSTVVEIGFAAATAGTVTNSTSTLISASATTIPTTGGYVIASSTAATLVLPPLTYINFKIGGGQTGGTVTPQGTCMAGFRDIVGSYTY